MNQPPKQPRSSISLRNPDFWIRLFADFILLEGSLLIAVLIYFAHPFEKFAVESISFTPIFLLPPLVCLPIHYLSGFYTYGRSYRGQFKIFIVAQSVMIGFLFLSAIAFFLPRLFSPPRTVLIASFLINLSSMLFARLWSYSWKWISSKELKSPIENQNNTVLVIGGAGYIGSALLGKLLKNGYQVRLLDLFLFGEKPIQEHLSNPNLKIYRGDFRQIDRLVEAIRGVGAVIHLGGIVGDPACALDEELTIQVNLTATRTIAEIAKGFNVNRFIFVSSCSVYGESDFILNENSQLNPVSLYAKSKIASELVLKNLANASFAPTILRFSTIYGLSGRTRFDLVVNLMTAHAVTEKRIRVFGGDQWRPFLHVDDAAESVFMALRAPKELVANEIFNVGDNNANMTLQQAAEKIQSMVPGSQLFISEPDGDRRNYRVDFSKINNTIKFKTNFDLEYGIQQVIDAIQSGVVSDYRDPKYSNFMFLKNSPQALKKHGPDWPMNLLLSAQFDDTDGCESGAHATIQ